MKKSFMDRMTEFANSRRSTYLILGLCAVSIIASAIAYYLGL